VLPTPAGVDVFSTGSGHFAGSLDGAAAKKLRNGRTSHAGEIRRVPSFMKRLST